MIHLNEIKACGGAAALLMLTVWTGCGDVLVTGDYPGQELIVVRGSVLTDGQGSPNLYERLRIAIHWVGSAEEQIVDRQLLTVGGLGQYTLRLYSPPGEAVMRQLPEGAGKIAMGRIFLYQDLNDDGRWSIKDEPSVGGATQQLLVYAPKEVIHPMLGTLVPSGYSVVYGRVCQEQELPLEQRPFTVTTPEQLNLTLLNDLSDLNLDINCDGRRDDPCLELIQALALDGSLDQTTRDMLIRDCYQLPPQEPPVTDPCEPQRLHFEMVRMGLDPDLFEQARQDYELCILSQEAQDRQACAPLEQRNMDGQCVCGEDGMSAISAQGECVPCDHPDSLKACGER